MSFNDIFKSSFLQNVTAISPVDIVISLVIAFGIGVFIFFVYKKTYQGLMYSDSFGTTLIALTMITTLVILAVTSNVVLSLGMVGALSIVRFRTAIKDPMDIAYLFWSIAVGIVVAAGMIPLAVFGSLCIGLMIFLFANRKTFTHPYVAVVACTSAAEAEVSSILRDNAQKSILRGKTARAGLLELTYDIRLKDDNTDFITKLSELEGVNNAALVSYNGDYNG